MRIQIIKRTLHFKFEAGTSRGVFTEKDVYYLQLGDNERSGVGECAPLKGLSIDAVPDFELHLQRYVAEVSALQNPWDFYALEGIDRFPSIIMGLETALLDLENGGKKVIYSENFANGQSRIPINGLIWMGKPDFMRQQLEEKLRAGFRCIKMKIGAIAFEEEYAILQSVRKQFSANDLELRVDANGAFSTKEALEKLEKLAKLDLHSIEQPIKQGQWEEMASLCAQTPLPIALDEEMIGIADEATQQALLATIQPQYIILKPTLHGGFRACDRWIALSEAQGIGWWMTSALESNIGLNAIAQFTDAKKVSLPQGLGTGQLFHNNIASPLSIANGHIFWDTGIFWESMLYPQE